MPCGGECVCAGRVGVREADGWTRIMKGKREAHTHFRPTHAQHANTQQKPLRLLEHLSRVMCIVPKK